MIGQLVALWIVVAAIVVWLLMRMPEADDIRLFAVGCAGTGIAIALLWMAIWLVRYPGARAGLLIALAIAGVVAAIWYPVALGWRPTLPTWRMPHVSVRLPRLSIPFHAAWPQARYQRRYTSMAAETWEVEEL